ncbi:hypothetical protein N801_06825 [Knoellia aerolata DSM 18566]|uniref:Uncharacterized protein n=2 Tax=Knoellia TaxID=136099 RepID=A0A0A0JZP5_9MICO|nr:hypothetical protein N801_06825 [Knoellia aerolata DSM 18566]
MARDRLVGVSTRLLAGASVLTTTGLLIGLRSAWQQYEESSEPDGSPLTLTFAVRTTLLVVESGFRPIGAQLLLASALVAVAVMALHRHPSWGQARRLRWEVLGALLLALVVVLGLVLANLYAMTSPDSAGDDPAGFFGTGPPTDLIVGNLMTLCASLLTLTGAVLWWVRLAPAPEVDLGESVDEEPTATDSTPGDASRDESTPFVDDGTTTDWSRDWSPEDFRPPR